MVQYFDGAVNGITAVQQAHVKCDWQGYTVSEAVIGY